MYYLFLKFKVITVNDLFFASGQECSEKLFCFVSASNWKAVEVSIWSDQIRKSIIETPTTNQFYSLYSNFINAALCATEHEEDQVSK